jgi:hypothetical protein
MIPFYTKGQNKIRKKEKTAKKQNKKQKENKKSKKAKKLFLLLTQGES